jgi:hypothetical protein
MDTDDLTPMAYATLQMAYEACEPMRAEIGAKAIHYRTEDEYLVGIAQFLGGVLVDPESHLEFWKLEDQADVRAFMNAVVKILEHVKTTLHTPRIERGKPPFLA